MKLKEGELNAYWREAKRRQYAKMPERQARLAIRDFKTKKEALAEGEDTSELLDNLLARIRQVLK